MTTSGVVSRDEFDPDFEVEASPFDPNNLSEGEAQMTTSAIVSGDEFHPEAFPFDTDNPSGVPGSTKIMPGVVAAIVGHAVSRVQGVDRLGNPSGILRAVANTLRSNAAARATGVGAEVGQREAIIDLDVVVVYGYRIPSVVQEIREVTAQEIFDQIGLVAKEVNVGIVGIEFPAGAAATRSVV